MPANTRSISTDTDTFMLKPTQIKGKACFVKYFK